MANTSTAEANTAMCKAREQSPATPAPESRSLRISPLSSAQRGLLIQEVARTIMEHLPLGSLLNLGLSCQALCGPAMDQLWRTLPSLAVLLQRLPEDLVQMIECPQYGHRVLNIKQIPQPHQWERVLHYARRVKIVISSRRDVSRGTLQMLARYFFGRCMFPHLKETRLSGPSCSREILLLPSRTVHYEIDLTRPKTWHLHRIPETSPFLEVLRITDSKVNSDIPIHYFVDPGVCGILSNTLLRLEYLTAVDFMANLDPLAIHHLASLPHLMRLALHLTDDCTPLDMATYTSTPFPSLHSLQIRGRNTTYLASWLSSVHLPSLKALNISTEKPPPAGISSVKELIGVVSRFDGLTYLKMRVAIIHKVLAPESILDPLLERLPSLEDFTLFGLAFNPTKISLLAMVSAWPRLRNLELHQTCYFKPSTHRISLRDLLIFAEHCPTIERIAMPLSPYMLVNPTRFQNDAVVVSAIPPTPSSSRSPYPISIDPVAPKSLPPSRLQVLQVADCFEPCDYQRIAEFLANVFPAASLTFHCPPSRHSVVDHSIGSILRLKEEYLRTR